MSLSQESLQAALGSYVFRFEASLDSSNDVALDWLREGAPDGAFVLADEQRRGKGRLGRTWYTPPGLALAVSMILRPTTQQMAQIGMMGALSVAQLCESLGLEDVGIKWPNDVQIAGRKVCGILPEAAWEQDRLLGVVLGMGVNVRVAFSGDLAATATSLESCTATRLDRTELLAELLGFLDGWRGQLGSAALFEAWRSRLNMLGKPVRVGELQGLALDVEDSGALRLQTDSGAIERVLAGDIMLM